MTEKRVPQDIIPALGVSMSQWFEAAERVILWEIGNCELLLPRNVSYEVPQNDLPMAHEINTRFYKRVEEVEGFFKTHPDYSSAPRVHLIFSEDPIIAACDWKKNGPQNSDVWMSRLFDIGNAQNWQGDLIVDYRKSPQTKRKESSWGRLLHELTKRDTRHVLLIINGYGAPALQNGFLMNQGIAESSGLFNSKITTLLRYAQGQDKKDHTYGSPWVNAQWHKVYRDKNTLFDETEKVLNKNIVFDRSKFKNVVDGLKIALSRLKNGERVVLRAPHRLGKSTALKSLASLHPSGVSVGGMLEGGELYLWGESVKKGFLNIEPILIVDEAGREGSEGTLRAIEETGRKVLRVYPGNSPPPSGFEVVDVTFRV